MSDAVTGGLADRVAKQINKTVRGAVIVESLVTNGFPTILCEKGNQGWWLDVMADPEGNGPGWVEVVEVEDDGPPEKPKPRQRRDLLSPGGVAKLASDRLGRRIDAAQVRQHIAQGRLPAYQLIGPNGEVTGYGIEESDAVAWQGPLKHGGRR